MSLRGYDAETSGFVVSVMAHFSFATVTKHALHFLIGKIGQRLEAKFMGSDTLFSPHNSINVNKQITLQILKTAEGTGEPTIK
jgi:hypothetical protein